MRQPPFCLLDRELHFTASAQAVTSIIQHVDFPFDEMA